MSHFNDLMVEGRTLNEDDDFNPLIDELIEDAIWDVCFEVHRAAKHKILLVNDSLELNENKDFRDSQKDYSGETLKKKKKKIKNLYQVTCDVCDTSCCGTKIVKHLETCFLGRGRSSAMAAKGKFKPEDDDEELCSDSEKKVKRNKRSQGKSRKGSGNPSSKVAYENFENMPYEKRIAFFSKSCGAISKRGKNMCQNSLNCSQHVEEQRLEIRRRFLGNMGDQTTNDGQMDIDTVDEDVSINGSSVSYANLY